MRQQPPGPERDAEIAALIAGAPSPVTAPEDFLRIGPSRSEELHRRVIEPYEALPWRALPDPSPAGALPAVAGAG